MTVDEYRKLTKRNKYGNNRTVDDADGTRWDSDGEKARWAELQLLEKAGRITNLERQISYLLIPKQPGEQAAYAKWDFAYVEKNGDKNGKQVAEDYKSAITRQNKDYILKRKLFKQLYPDIEFRETT